MKDRKLKTMVNNELEDNKHDATSEDDYYFEFLNTELSKEIQSFWKLLEVEDKE